MRDSHGEPILLRPDIIRMAEDLGKLVGLDTATFISAVISDLFEQEEAEGRLAARVARLPGTEAAGPLIAKLA